MTTIAYAGGVVVHFKDGRREQVRYGETLNLDEVEDYQVPELLERGLVDDIERETKQAQQTEVEESDLETKDAGVKLESVPGDYNTLTEAEASGVVRSFTGKPRKQGEVLAYEALHQNRRFVLDQGTPRAKEEAAKLLSKIKGDSGQVAQAEESDVPPPEASTEAPSETPPPNSPDNEE